MLLTSWCKRKMYRNKFVQASAFWDATYWVSRNEKHVNRNGEPREECKLGIGEGRKPDDQSKQGSFGKHNIVNFLIGATGKG